MNHIEWCKLQIECFEEQAKCLVCELAWLGAVKNSGKGMVMNHDEWCETQKCEDVDGVACLRCKIAYKAGGLPPEEKKESLLSEEEVKAINKNIPIENKVLVEDPKKPMFSLADESDTESQETAANVSLGSGCVLSKYEESAIKESGPGYEYFIADKRIIKDTDECLSMTGEWKKTIVPGTTATPLNTLNHLYRRKLESEKNTLEVASGITVSVGKYVELLIVEREAIEESGSGYEYFKRDNRLIGVDDEWFDTVSKDWILTNTGINMSAITNHLYRRKIEKQEETIEEYASDSAVYEQKKHDENGKPDNWMKRKNGYMIMYDHCGDITSVYITGYNVDDAIGNAIDSGSISTIESIRGIFIVKNDVE